MAHHQVDDFLSDVDDYTSSPFDFSANDDGGGGEHNDESESIDFETTFASVLEGSSPACEGEDISLSVTVSSGQEDGDDSYPYYPSRSQPILVRGKRERPNTNTNTNRRFATSSASSRNRHLRRQPQQPNQVSNSDMSLDTTLMSHQSTFEFEDLDPTNMSSQDLSMLLHQTDNNNDDDDNVHTEAAATEAMSLDDDQSTSMEFQPLRRREMRDDGGNARRYTSHRHHHQSRPSSSSHHHQRGKTSHNHKYDLDDLSWSTIGLSIGDGDGTGTVASVYSKDKENPKRRKQATKASSSRRIISNKKSQPRCTSTLTCASMTEKMAALNDTLRSMNTKTTIISDESFDFSLVDGTLSSLADGQTFDREDRRPKTNTRHEKDDAGENNKENDRERKMSSAINNNHKYHEHEHQNNRRQPLATAQGHHERDMHQLRSTARNKLDKHGDDRETHVESSQRRDHQHDARSLFDSAGDTENAPAIVSTRSMEMRNEHSHPPREEEENNKRSILQQRNAVAVTATTSATKQPPLPSSFSLMLPSANPCTGLSLADNDTQSRIVCPLEQEKDAPSLAAPDNNNRDEDNVKKNASRDHHHDLHHDPIKHPPGRAGDHYCATEDGAAILAAEMRKQPPDDQEATTSTASSAMQTPPPPNHYNCAGNDDTKLARIDAHRDHDGCVLPEDSKISQILGNNPQDDLVISSPIPPDDGSSGTNNHLSGVDNGEVTNDGKGSTLCDRQLNGIQTHDTADMRINRLTSSSDHDNESHLLRHGETDSNKVMLSSPTADAPEWAVSRVRSSTPERMMDEAEAEQETPKELPNEEVVLAATAEGVEIDDDSDLQLEKVTASRRARTANDVPLGSFTPPGGELVSKHGAQTTILDQHDKTAHEDTPSIRQMHQPTIDEAPTYTVPTTSPDESILLPTTRTRRYANKSFERASGSGTGNPTACVLSMDDNGGVGGGGGDTINVEHVLTFARRGVTTAGMTAIDSSLDSAHRNVSTAMPVSPQHVSLSHSTSASTPSHHPHGGDEDVRIVELEQQLVNFQRQHELDVQDYKASAESR
jgi:hypothetical protein